MQNTFLKRFGIIFPLAVVLCGLALMLLDPVPLQVLRHTMFDQYQRWQPREYVDVPVRIVDIDEASLARLGQWPWPRTRIAALIEQLDKANVAALGFDVVFAEADRTSPRAMAQEWSAPMSLRQTLQALPDHDQLLAARLRDSRSVLGMTLQSKSGSTAQPNRPFRFIYSGQSPAPRLHRFLRVIPALPLLQLAALGNGALSFIPDSDGVVRRVPMVLQLGTETLPSLSAEMLRVAQGEKNYILKTVEGDNALEEVRIGQLAIPTTAQGELWVHYTRAMDKRYLPAWKVLSGQIPSEQLAGQLVLIGSSAQGLMDLRFSPLGQIIPGVEVHAQALEQILAGQVLQRPNWALALESVLLLLGGASIAVLAIRTGSLIAASLTTVLVSSVLGLGWYAFATHALLLNTLTPCLVFVGTFVMGSLLHHLMSEHEQRWIKAAFSRYVSPNRVDHLIEHPDDIQLGGHRQECSFIFTDLAGFTSLMEKRDPAEAVSLLNAYLDQMISIAFRHEGTLDRIVGDAVAIMFSAPVVQADHRERAIACALEMHQFASAYMTKLNAQGIPFGHTRIGIHAGEVIVGNFGGTTIFDYRALGDVVNTASRLEGANKYLGTCVCLSEAVLQGVSSVRVRPIGRLLLKGKTQALLVYEPLSVAKQTGYAPLDAYCAAWQLMTELLPSASAAFSALYAQYPNDPLVVLHCRRLDRGEQGDLIRLSEK